MAYEHLTDEELKRHLWADPFRDTLREELVRRVTRGDWGRAEREEIDELTEEVSCLESRIEELEGQLAEVESS